MTDKFVYVAVINLLDIVLRIYKNMFEFSITP